MSDQWLSLLVTAYISRVLNLPFYRSAWDALPQRSSVLYVSDHGESLGEDGLYLHGTPKFIAPDEQRHVANMLWLSNRYIVHSKLDVGCLQQNAVNKTYSHDYVSHTLLDLTAVETPVYNPDLSMLSGCVSPVQTIPAAVVHVAQAVSEHGHG